MFKKSYLSFALLLVTLLLTVTSVLAATDYILFGKLVITEPRTDGTITAGDTINLSLGYDFVEQAGTAQAALIGYDNADCAGNKWQAPYVSTVVTVQAASLVGEAVMSVSADSLTPSTQSVSVELRLDEPNYHAASRLGFYCLEVVDNASEGSESDSANLPDTGALRVMATSPGWGSTISAASQVDVTFAYRFLQNPGQIHVGLIGLDVSCDELAQVSDPEAYPFVSAEETFNATTLTGNASFSLFANQLQPDTESVLISGEIVENGNRLVRWIGNCLSVSP